MSFSHLFHICLLSTQFYLNVQQIEKHCMSLILADFGTGNLNSIFQLAFIIIILLKQCIVDVDPFLVVFDFVISEEFFLFYISKVITIVYHKL